MAINAPKMVSVVQSAYGFGDGVYHVFHDGRIKDTFESYEAVENFTKGLDFLGTKHRHITIGEDKNDDWELVAKWGFDEQSNPVKMTLKRIVTNAREMDISVILKED